jgi:hypothetical protein
MKYSSFFLPGLIAIAFVNCTKNTGTNINTNIDDTSLVKTLTEDFAGLSPNIHSVFTFNYDAQKRISEITSDSVNIDFEYSNGLITKNIYPIGQPPQHNYYYFNNDSLLDSAFLTLDPITTNHVYYQYDPGNGIVQRIEYAIINGGDTMTRYAYKYGYDNRENPVLISAYFIEGPADSGLVYQDQFIYSGSANIVTSADMMYPDHMRSKNLLSSTNHLSQLPGVSYSETYSYEFDDHNRLKTLMVQNNSSSPYTYIKNYTYY